MAPVLARIPKVEVRGTTGGQREEQQHLRRLWNAVVNTRPLRKASVREIPRQLPQRVHRGTRRLLATFGVPQVFLNTSSLIFVVGQASASFWLPAAPNAFLDYTVVTSLITHYRSSRSLYTLLQWLHSLLFHRSSKSASRTSLFGPC